MTLFTIRRFIWAGVILAAVHATPVDAVLLPRIQLLSDVRVDGPGLFLSDLLPADAPAPFRALATKIPLGAAPLCGTSRVLDRDGLTQHMGIGLDLLNQVIVPERVLVSCDSRPITVSEVFAAIQRDLESKTMAVADFSLDDLTFQSQVFAKFGDAHLHVVRSEFDEPLKRARFVLTSGAGSAGLPFVVTARLGAGSESAPLRNATEAKQLDVYSQTAGPSRKAEILVAAGKQARLVLRSASIEMVEDVVPLEQGVLGQQIRVRMLDTGKVSKARVDGASHLEMAF